MVAKSAVMHVVKYEKVKVIDGDTNLAARGFDGYTVFARIYHDVFVPENKQVAIYVHESDAAAAAKPVVELDIRTTGSGATTKIKAINTLPGNILAFVGTTTETGVDAAGKLSDISKFTAARVGDTIAATSTFYAVDGNLNILTKKTITIG